MKQFGVTTDEWLSMVVCGGVSALLLVIGRGNPFVFGTAAGVTLLLVSAVRNPAARQQLILLAFLLATSLVAVGLVDLALAPLTTHTIDGAFLRLDRGFSTRFYHWALHHDAIRLSLDTVYYGLPLYGAFVLKVSPRRMACAAAWILAALLAPFFYLVFPAVGPAHISQLDAPRNCMPSLHMTWCLLCAVYITPRLRNAAAVFALLTAVSTLSTGEHYVIDLVAAVSFTFAICWLQSRLCSMSAFARLRALATRPALSAAASASLPSTLSYLTPDGVTSAHD
jgi:hypothetical protein